MDSTVMTFEITFDPVHMMSIPGRSLAPIVLRYSEFLTLGTALAEQYSVGQKMNLGWFSKRGIKAGAKIE